MQIEQPFRLVWVTRSFLDYRIPVFAALDRLVNGNFCLIYSKEFTPERVWRNAEEKLCNRAIGLSGEKAFGYKGNITSELANSKIRIPCQPGLYKAIRAQKPDILIGDGFFQWSWTALFYRLLHRTPLVVCYERTAHTERNAQWWRVLFRKVVIRFLGAMCVNGKLSNEYVQSLGMVAHHITVGHMVADVTGLYDKSSLLSCADIVKARKDLGIDTDDTVFFQVSQLIKRKGVSNLLHGWKRFVDSCKKIPVKLIVAGDGPERPVLEEFCKNMGLRDVLFVGSVSHEEIHRYYALADIFVIPTLEDNWSLVVPEAMACGKPILCSKYNGCWPELVHEGVNGWVFDPLNIDDIAATLRKCIDQIADLSAMGAASQRIIASHTSDHAAKAILDACQIALNNRPISSAR